MMRNMVHRLHSEDGKFCPECQKEGQTSIVYVGHTTSTAAWAEPYYDEEGRYHYHDPNTYTTHYRCSNGHEWIEQYQSSCWCEQERKDESQADD